MQCYNPKYDYYSESVDRDFACFYDCTSKIPSYCLWSGDIHRISLESVSERISWWTQFNKHASEDVRNIAYKWINVLQNNDNLQLISWANSYGYKYILPKIMGSSYCTLSIKFLYNLESIHPSNIYQGVYDVSQVPLSIIKKIIGKDGCYFKMTTSNYNLDLIWYNQNTKNIEFWGSVENIQKGCKFIKTRINRHVSNQ